MSLSRRTLTLVLAIFGGLAAMAALLPPAQAADALKQVKLSEELIQRFIAAQGEMNPIFEKLPAPDSGAPLDPKVKADLEAIANKHGFSGLTGFDDVAFSVSMVMAGIDPASGAFTEPKQAIQNETERIKADASIPAERKKVMLDELAEALKHAQPVTFPENIELVKKYFKQIEKVLAALT